MNRLLSTIAVRGGVTLAAVSSWFLVRKKLPTQRLGTRYGGWILCAERIRRDATAICVGAGEDISFDVDLQRTTGCHVVILDPTPRAIAHVGAVLTALTTGVGSSGLVIGSTEYQLLAVNRQRVTFKPVALWASDGELTFHAPQNPNHVSYSAVNLQGTERTISVPCMTFRSLVSKLGVDHIELLKIDIEGAELNVLNDLLAHGPLPDQLLVEFDSLVSGKPALVLGAFKCLRELSKRGFQLIARERVNFVFMRNSEHSH